MPATVCNDTDDYIALTFMGMVDFFVEWTWDGVSVPPRCFGAIDAIRWNNRDPDKTYYGRIAQTKAGTIVKQITPAGTAGASGREVRRAVLHNLGLDDTHDIGSVNITEQPPQPGETVVT